MVLLDAGAFDWSHVAETFFGGVGALATAFTLAWTMYSKHKDASDKKANEEREALIEAVRQAEAKQDKRHEENKQVLGKITSVLRFVPPHKHREINGALTTDGIDYGPDWD